MLARRSWHWFRRERTGGGDGYAQAGRFSRSCNESERGLPKTMAYQRSSNFEVKATCVALELSKFNQRWSGQWMNEVLLMCKRLQSWWKISCGTPNRIKLNYSDCQSIIYNSDNTVGNNTRNDQKKKPVNWEVREDGSVRSDWDRELDSIGNPESRFLINLRRKFVQQPSSPVQT